MNLTYRGMNYTPSTPSLEMSALETVSLHGRRVYAQPYQVTQRHQMPTELSYRGHRYSH